MRNSKPLAGAPGHEPAANQRTHGWTQRVARGLAANVAGNALTLVIQLVSVPVLLGAWGVPIYGEWLILSAVPVYVALSDLSFATVAGSSMTMLAAAGKREEAAAMGRQVWSLVTLMTAAIAVGAIAIALVFGGIFGSDGAISVSEAQFVLAALFTQVAIGNQFAVLDAWFKAGGRYPLGVALRQLARFLEFAALVAAVLLGGGPGAAAGAFLVGSFVGLTVSWLVVRRAVPWSTFRPDRPHLKTFRDLLAPGLAFMAFPLGTALSVQGLTIAIGITLGASAVVVFATARTITRLIPQVMHSINLSFWPELSRSIGAGLVLEARAIQRHAVQLSLAVSVLAAALLAIAGQAIINVWTHGLVNPQMELIAVLLLVILASSTWFTLSTVLVATNRHVRMAQVYLASTTAAVLLAFPLSAAFGLVGAATALLAIDVVMVVYVIPAALRIVGDSPIEFLRAVLDVKGSLRPAPGGRTGRLTAGLEGSAVEAPALPNQASTDRGSRP